MKHEPKQQTILYIFTICASHLFGTYTQTQIHFTSDSMFLINKRERRLYIYVDYRDLKFCTRNKSINAKPEKTYGNCG